MTTRIATANGLLTDAATWAEVDATSFLDADTFQTTLTTSYIESDAFTPGAIDVDGIAVKFGRRLLSTGTVTVRLAVAGADVVGTPVTINLTDIEAATVFGQLDWYFFKFAAPVTLIAATAYTVSLKTSITDTLTAIRTSPDNFARMLRTPTTGAPASGDNLFILGEWTAPATKTNRTVTMDETTTTDYGDNSVGPARFGIGKGGVLTWGVVAATNYILRLSTSLKIARGGVMNMGSTGAPCTRDSSMQLEFDCSADSDFGLICWGALNTQGLSRTIGKNIVRCLLTVDKASSATTISVDTDTGWLDTDEIAIAPTEQSWSEGEAAILSGDASTGSFNVTTGLTNAHKGTSPRQADVILLTRNVRIRSVSTSNMTYVYFGSCAVVDCDWTEFRYLGGGSTNGQRGIESDVNATGSLAMSFCSIRNFEFYGIYINAANADNFAIDNFVAWSVGGSTNQAAIRVSPTTGINWSLVNIMIILNSNQGSAMNIGAYGGTLTNIRVCACQHGLWLTCPTTAPESIQKVWNGVEAYVMNGGGIYVGGLDVGKISNVKIWHCNIGTAAAGIYLFDLCGRIIIDGGAVFGNPGPHNIAFANNSGSRSLVLRNLTIDNDLSADVNYGVSFGSSDSNIGLEIENCVLGGLRGHTLGDIYIGTAGQARIIDVTLRNALLSSTTKIVGLAYARGRSIIRYQKAQQVTNVHYTHYPRLGTITYEGTVYRTTAPSEALTPSGRGPGEKLESGVIRVPITSGDTVSISVYVRKSTLYAGSSPRLMQKFNPAIGMSNEVVIATFIGAADTWIQLSGTTAVATENGVAEFYVDCDGAAGIVYVDDITAA